MLSLNECKEINTNYQAIFVADFYSESHFMSRNFQRYFRNFYKIAIPFYTAFLLYIMFFGFGRSQYEINIVRLLPMFSTFDFVKDAIGWKTVLINILGNILMFAPFGFLGIIFQKLIDFKTLIINFLSAIILIESLQYFTRLGVFDIDDIILNTVGVAIGFSVYKFFKLNKPLNKN